MRNKKIVLFIIAVFIAGIILGSMFSLRDKSINIKKSVSGYSFEVSNKDIINKKLEGEYLNSFVTIINQQDEFIINLDGINSDNNVYIINPEDGSKIPMRYYNGKFTGEVKLQNDINYGIIMGYNLIGSIRVVDNIKNIDEDMLFSDILISLGCGIK